MEAEPGDPPNQPCRAHGEVEPRREEVCGGERGEVCPGVPLRRGQRLVDQVRQGEAGGEGIRAENTGERHIGRRHVHESDSDASRRDSAPLAHRPRSLVCQLSGHALRIDHHCSRSSLTSHTRHARRESAQPKTCLLSPSFGWDSSSQLPTFILPLPPTRSLIVHSTFTSCYPLPLTRSARPHFLAPLPLPSCHPATLPPCGPARPPLLIARAAK
jgi:hypothetical protein